jgi:hypothetical protein
MTKTLKKIIWKKEFLGGLDDEHTEIQGKIIGNKLSQSGIEYLTLNKDKSLKIAITKKENYKPAQAIINEFYQNQ